MRALRSIREYGLKFAMWLVFTGLGMSACSSKHVTESSAPDARPNIILIMADDMGWGDTGYAGSEFAITPNLDDMAQSGAVFNRFYSAAPVCSPTRGSVLTGRHPFRYGVYYANVGHLPEEEKTIAEYLKAAGYRTGFFGKWHLGTLTKDVIDANRGGRPENVGEYSPPIRHGFDTVFASESKMPTFDPMIKPKIGERKTWWDVVDEPDNQAPFGTYYWDKQGSMIKENLKGDDTRVIVDRALPFIEKSAQDDAPFLAVIWAHAPHLPVVAAKSDTTKIKTKDPYTAHYFGSILAMDRQIGRIRNTLKDQGISDNTVLWFMSDNGPERKVSIHAPGSAGDFRGTKRDLYEGGIRVPGIIEWPRKINSNTVINMPAVTSDVMPTVLDLANVKASALHPIDGISLAQTFDGSPTQRLAPIGFESAHKIAFIDDRYKIIHTPKSRRAENPNLSRQISAVDIFSGQAPATDLDFELYDIINDPRETMDLSAEMPEEVYRLKTKLENWRASVANSIAGKDYLVDNGLTRTP